MRFHRHFFLLPVLLLVSGCAFKGSYIEKRGVLDESLYYYEQDSRGVKRAISGDLPEDPKKGEPARVPHPALVDIDSLIHILVAKERLAFGKDEGLLAVRSEELKVRKKLIREALEGLEEVIRARRKAVEAYLEADLDTFMEMKRGFGKATKGLNKRLKELWPRGTPENMKLTHPDKNVRAYDPPHFKRLQEFLQAKIDALEEEDRAIVEEVTRRAISLRIEAFLKSPKKDPVAVHLDGYDKIKQGEFQRRDRLGLDLSDEERERLEDQVEATHKIAATAERVRREEISLNDALKETITLVSPRLGQLMPKVEDLMSKFEEEALKERLDKARVLIDRFVEEVKRQAESQAKEIEGDLEKMPEEFRAFLEKKSGRFRKVFSLLKKVDALQTRWSSATQTALPVLIMDTIDVLGELEKLLYELPELAQDFEENLKLFLDEEFEAIGDNAINTLIDVAKSGEALKLRVHIEEFYQDLKSVKEITNEVAAVLGVLRVKDVAVGTRAPESLKVPLEDVKDTFIDLKYTPRLIDDTVTVRATLYKGEGENEEEKDSTTASFQVKRFGWYARLSPAVVLVTPDRLKGDDDGFRFAPTLSWMHHFVPRPEDSAWYAHIMRGFQPAIGIHSAFLNFDSGGSGEAIQVGLGTTASFWDNRLQFGIGYNLMAESDDEGRYYYFVGTDLIGLLQTIGIGK